MAELSITSASRQGESSIRDEDCDFEPSADMLVHDFDDEQTLEEEEMLQGETNFSAEIDDLTREGEIPIHELLKMYGYAGADSAEEADGGTDQRRVSESSRSSAAQGEVQEVHENDKTKEAPVAHHRGDDSHSSSDDSASCGRTLGIAQLIDSETGGYFDGNDAVESDDEDYIPCEEWKKEVMVGPMYQAEMLPGLCEYKDNEKAYENDDQLLWNPELLPEKEVVEFLAEASKRSRETPGMETVPEKPLVKDNEQALYELVKCNFNKEKALKSLKFSIKPAKELSIWSEEERQDFEQVDKACGNDLTCVQGNKQMKLWRRNPSLPPCGTEPADRLLGEAESGEVSAALAPPAGPSSCCSTTHSCGDSQSSEQLLVCINDPPSDNSHTNGSSHVPDLSTPAAAFPPGSDPDTSRRSVEANRLAGQGQDEEGLERPPKRPKTEVELHPTPPVTGTMEAL
ncbi:mesoderm induction early response protein 1a isoform X2 [Brachyhypopomus gauderio]|uniref:mesoderm induction early response protein 1a isoform X2 n=1 Tax=Brachyhypopomus gauderio TaxID=698409 RepID=UPI004042BEE7